MKAQSEFLTCPKFHSFGAIGAGAIILMSGVIASSAQTGDYLYSGSLQTVTLCYSWARPI